MAKSHAGRVFSDPPQSRVQKDPAYIRKRPGLHSQKARPTFAKGPGLHSQKDRGYIRKDPASIRKVPV